MDSRVISAVGICFFDCRRLGVQEHTAAFTMINTDHESHELYRAFDSMSWSCQILQSTLFD